VDFKLELVLIPVSDVDRAKAFYLDKCGFSLDVDHEVSEEFRVVQMTPPGSACSITIGRGMTDAEPGSYRGTHLVVSDIEAARAELLRRGVEVSTIRHFDRASGDWKPARIPSTASTTRSPTSATRTATPGSCKRSRPRRTPDLEPPAAAAVAGTSRADPPSGAGRAAQSDLRLPTRSKRQGRRSGGG
jgi:catechol 2,3-dioxygenase-like lactoylglutathione lyase family enzyme